jgi:hypothetical protein
MMNANVGTIDRVLRLAVGVAVIAFGYMGGLAAPWDIVVMVVGGVLVGTAAIGWCPPYALFGINTCSKADS